MTEPKITSLHANDETYIEIPCLGGADVNRRESSLVVLIQDGRMYHSRTGDLLVVRGHTTLAGWGQLDGPAINIGPEHMWHVAIPVDLMQVLVGEYGLDCSYIEAYARGERLSNGEDEDPPSLDDILSAEEDEASAAEGRGGYA